MDADTLTRIAHIDRPTGARPTLYPTISSLRPSLLFERSNSLLVAWGDCLMSMGIREVTTVPVGSAMTGLDAGGTSQTVVRRRTVECTMAWELDCVACGVAPLDDDNVVVLGLVPPLDDENEEEEEVDDIVVVHENGGDDQNIQGAGNGASIRQGGNDLEMQIISRKDGTIVYSDSLPMLKNPLQNKQPQQQTPGGSMAESASSYNLLSSFALPRMDDAAEAEEASLTGQLLEQAFDLNVSSIFSPASEVGKRPFRDVHLEWDLKSIMFQEDKRKNFQPSDDPINRWYDEKDHKDYDDDDAHSVDSDDYGFIIKPLFEPELLQQTITTGPAPIMVVTSGSDVVLSRMGDVDDAVAHALAKNKRGLALRRALRHKRQLRRYELSDLVNSYLQALLRLQKKAVALLEEDKEDEGKDSDAPSPSLSLRRMTLAVQSMPVLLGGDVSLWQRWAQELEGIPGALFLLRDHLPVRGKFFRGPHSRLRLCASVF
jgi:vacuolar protein sorting-associated protein 41